MGIDPELLKQLIETFKVELEEQLQLLTDALLELEKNPTEQNKELIAQIFRAAHTIKGAARSTGIHGIADIAHHLESLFAMIQKNKLQLSSKLTDLSLEAIDKMRLTMQASLNPDHQDWSPDGFLENMKKQIELLTLNSTGKEDVQIKNTSEIQQESSDTRPNAKTKDQSEKKNPPSETIRVGLDQVEEVTALLEEMQINKIAIEAHYKNLSQLKEKLNIANKKFKGYLDRGFDLKSETSEFYNGFQRFFQEDFKDINDLVSDMKSTMFKRIYELNNLSRDLQGEVRKLRLVPVSYALSDLPRMVRDLSKNLHKKVDLKIIGEEIHLDKIILENLKSPLMHLIRNAIDHGIETPEVRKKNNKPEKGTIVIRIMQKDDKILLSIEDDGAGIDSDQIKKILKKKNLLPASQVDSLSPNELLKVIFQPGFSTKEIITDLSGRGVGLDVVNSNLLNLKGQIRVYSEVGKKTMFSMELPLTLTQERGLLIRVKNNFFIMPSHAIERVMLFNPKELVHVEATEAILVAEEPIVLRSLANILDLDLDEEMPTKNNSLSVIILNTNSVRVALFVDEIIEELEIIIKPFQNPLNSINYFLGGTLSGSEHVIIVLNPNEIVKKTQSLSSSLLMNRAKEEPTEPKKAKILVVDDSITTRTLEKNILEHKGYEVVVAVNGKDAWDLLQKQKFSLLITDVMMPIMDGFTLTEKIKKQKNLRDLPIIIVTSLGNEEEKRRGIEVGADAYIVKNAFESTSLLNIVSQLV